MSKDNKGTREMLFHDNAPGTGVAAISKTRKHSVNKQDPFGTHNSFGREISLGSLRARNQKMGMGMGGMDSNTSLTVR